MDKRTEYAEKLSARMVEWDMQIDQLKIKATSATPEAMLEYSKAIKALQLKRDEAALKLQNIPITSDDEWEVLKAGIDQIWNEITTMLRDLFKKVK
ncbi:MAG: hypothetical protein EG822_06315 [Deltaproteobacteria bacterium]|nr:hypothetical protein [Deltaproteobacteria bacterium]TLN04912.1 MAG: hypothetical protein FDZ73_01225 [bacterium]